jgi:hypothetical protein
MAVWRKGYSSLNQPCLQLTKRKISYKKNKNRSQKGFFAQEDSLS